MCPFAQLDVALRGRVNEAYEQRLRHVAGRHRVPLRFDEQYRSADVFSVERERCTTLVTRDIKDASIGRAERWRILLPAFWIGIDQSRGRDIDPPCRYQLGLLVFRDPRRIQQFGSLPCNGD